MLRAIVVSHANLKENKKKIYKTHTHKYLIVDDDGDEEEDERVYYRCVYSKRSYICICIRRERELVSGPAAN